MLGSVYLLSAKAPVEGALSKYGDNEIGCAGSAPTQPEEYQRGDSAKYADGDHRVIGIWQVVAGVRHDLCRRATALCGIALGVCAAIPRPDGAAGSGCD